MNIFRFYPDFSFRLTIAGLILALSLLAVSEADAQRRNTAPASEMDMHHGLIYQRYHNKPFTGTAVETFPNGRRQGEVPIVEGLLHGRAREWDIDGTLILEAFYEKGKQTGKETQWYNDGTVKALAFYENDLLHGKATEYHPNGLVRSEGVFREGFEQGVHTWYFPDGSKEREVTFVDGKVAGYIREWHANGELKMQAAYTAGEANGPWKEWYSNGGLRVDRHYSMGKEHGAFKLYTEDGYLLEIAHYDEGELGRIENFRSGSVRISAGYVVVVNKPGLSYTMLIPGNNVRPLSTADVSYMTDGMVVMAGSLPVNHFLSNAENPAKPSEVLELYRQHELDRIAESTGVPAQAKGVHHQVNGRPAMLYWYITTHESPVSERTGRSIEEEHFVAVYLGAEILHLYVPKTNDMSRDDVRALLLEIAGSVYQSSKAIDLNSIRLD